MAEQGPLAAYQRLVATDDYHHDEHQAAIATHLQVLYEQITSPSRRWFWQAPEHVKGLYIYGGVGRGKTWLMDIFHESLPGGVATRIHFHRFMLRVHKALSELKGHRSPLSTIGKQWASQNRVLCLDEFFVSDIGDAMLLAGLLKSLFENGVTLVTTSNVQPKDLYADGLQRARFLPAIDLLEKHTEILCLDSPTDYRLRILQAATTWHTPVDSQSEQKLKSIFEQICPAAAQGAGTIDVNGRSIATRGRGDGVIWFDFDALFRSHRSAEDYIEIARSFNTVMIAGVPVLNENDADAARRFVTAIDEFYDRNIKVVCSAQAAIVDIYSGQRLAFEFERTASRLIEMQSQDYLASQHKA